MLILVFEWYKTSSPNLPDYDWLSDSLYVAFYYRVWYEFEAVEKRNIN